MNEIEKIIAQDFARVTNASQVVVSFDTEEEVVSVTADGIAYMMQVGSDDNEFAFVNLPTGNTVHVPFSPEYLAANE